MRCRSWRNGRSGRARDRRLNRDAAVKLMPMTACDAQAAARFEVEARTAARLSDPHVVAVYDSGTFAEHH